MIEIIFILVTIIAIGLLGIGQLSDKNINLTAFFIGAILLFSTGLAMMAEGVTTNQIQSIPVTLDVNGNINQYDVNYVVHTPSTDFGINVLSYLYFVLGLVFMFIGGAEFAWKKTKNKMLNG